MSYEERCRHDDFLNAPDLVDPRHAKLLEQGVSRAGGGAVCAICGHCYYDHPRVVGALWATELCGGGLVKL